MTAPNNFLIITDRQLFFTILEKQKRFLIVLLAHNLKTMMMIKEIMERSVNSFRFGLVAPESQH